MQNIKSVIKPKNITREDAIKLNREKCNNPVISYTNKNPIYEKSIGFMAKHGKIRNTETFIITNRNNIMQVIQENEAREKFQEEVKNYKKMVMNWSLAIAKKISKRKQSNPKKKIKLT
jgi:hypothetical protein